MSTKTQSGVYLEAKVPQRFDLQHLDDVVQKMTNGQACLYNEDSRYKRILDSGCGQVKVFVFIRPTIGEDRKDCLKIYLGAIGTIGQEHSYLPK